MADRLAEMLDAQRRLQELINGYTLKSQSDDLRVANIKENVLALTVELCGELLGEVGWKSWATSRHINYEAARGEVVDCWHFLMNIMLHLEMTTDDLYEGYLRKREVNVRRQVDGYDGISTKCDCGRALEDVSIIEVYEKLGNTAPMAYLCAECRAHIPPELARRFISD